MKCANPACGKNVKTPLELFNGVLTCPYCKTELSVIHDFKITKENNDLYNLSQLYYFKYLALAGDKSNFIGKEAEKMKRTLDIAISTCKNSAYLGHPLAVLKMGDYYQNYFESSLSESDRKRIAFEYYASLCYSSKTFVEQEEGVSGFSSEDFSMIKRQSAINLYRLVSGGEKEFGSFKKYNKELNKKRIVEQYGVVDIDGGISGEEERSKAEQIKKLFHSCVSKKSRSPLFGIYRLKGYELKSVFETQEEDKNKSIFRIISKGLQLRYIESKNGRVDEIDGYFTKMTNATSVYQMLEDIKNENEYYLYFFNPLGRHEYLSSVQTSKVMRALEDKQFESIKRLINGGAEDCTFFDDDVIMFIKGKNVKTAIDGLMDYICEEK